MAAVVVSLRCVGEADVNRSIQTWRTSNHAVGSDALASWSVEPTAVPTECDFAVTPRGAFSAAGVVTVSLDAVVPIRESSDIGLTACRAVGVAIDEVQAGSFAVIVAPVISRFVPVEVAEIDLTETVILEVEATGADRCAVSGVEVIRSAADQTIFVLPLPSTAVASGAVSLTASCRLGAEASVAFPTAVRAFRGSVNRNNAAIFADAATGPEVLFGSVTLSQITLDSVVSLDSLRLIAGGVSVSGNNAGVVCSAAFDVAISFQGLTKILRRLSVDNNFINNADEICPGGVDVSFPTLIATGELTIGVSGLAGSLDLPALTTIVSGGLRVDEGVVEVDLPSLESVTGTINIVFNDTLVVLGLASLQSARSIDLSVNSRLTLVDLSSLISIGPGNSEAEGFVLNSNATDAPATDELIVRLPDQVSVAGVVDISFNRRITQAEALALAAKFDNTGFPTPTVTNNQP